MGHAHMFLMRISDVLEWCSDLFLAASSSSLILNLGNALPTFLPEEKGTRTGIDNGKRNVVVGVETRNCIKGWLTSGYLLYLCRCWQGCVIISKLLVDSILPDSADGPEALKLMALGDLLCDRNYVDSLIRNVASGRHQINVRILPVVSIKTILSY